MKDILALLGGLFLWSLSFVAIGSICAWGAWADATGNRPVQVFSAIAMIMFILLAGAFASMGAAGHGCTHNPPPSGHRPPAPPPAPQEDK